MLLKNITLLDIAVGADGGGIGVCRGGGVSGYIGGSTGVSRASLNEQAALT